MPMSEEDLDEVVREKDAPFANGYGYEDKVDKGVGAFTCHLSTNTLKKQNKNLCHLFYKLQPVPTKF